MLFYYTILYFWEKVSIIEEDSSAYAIRNNLFRVTVRDVAEVPPQESRTSANVQASQGKENIMTTETQSTKSSEESSKVTEDRRWRMVNRTMRMYGNEPNALIEALHTVQESFGFLDTEALKYVAKELKVPLSRIFGVATFYHFFTLKPQGEHICVVCLGTACYIGGAANILSSIEESLGVHPGETTKDNKVSLVTARCFGSCGLAPAATFDGQVAGKLTAPAVLEKIGRWFKHDA